MDMMEIAGMVFTLLMVTIIGGFILLFPLTRRLGALLEQRLQGKQVEALGPRGLAELRREIRTLQEAVEKLSERQAFTDALLEVREQSLLSSVEKTPSAAKHPHRTDVPA
jgi:hypothetical protein